MRAALILGLIAALGGEVAAQTRLGPQVSLAQGSFNSGGGITVAVELRRTPQGGTALCGAWAESDSQTVHTVGTARGILDSASVHVDGRRVAARPRAFPRIAPRLDYAGAEARCVAIDAAWKPGRVPQVFLPRQIIQAGGRDALGNQVSFRPGGPGARGEALEIVPFLRRQSRLVRLTPAAAVSGGRYSSGGGLRIAAEILPVRGRAHLCGVWSDLPGQASQTEGAARLLLREAVVTLGGRRLDVDPGMFRRVQARDEVTGAHANCLDIGLDWQPAMARTPLRIAVPARIVHRSTTASGTRVIRFIPS